MIPRNILQQWQLEQLAITVDVVQYIVRASTTEALTTCRENENEWTADEVIGHLRDGERTFEKRARDIITYDCPELTIDDPAELVRRGRYNECDPAALLDEWRGLREAHISFLSTLSEEQWLRNGVFPGNLLYDLNDHIALMCRHDLLHINQMMRTLNTIRN